MQNNSADLLVIKAMVESGQSPVRGVPIDIAYKPERGWTLITYTDSLRDLSGEDRLRFANWLIGITQELNRLGITTYLERG